MGTNPTPPTHLAWRSKGLQKYNARNYNQENKLLEYEWTFSENHSCLHVKMKLQNEYVAVSKEITQVTVSFTKE